MNIVASICDLSERHWSSLSGGNGYMGAQGLILRAHPCQHGNLLCPLGLRKQDTEKE